MSNIATDHPPSIGRNPQWMRVAVVGLAALLLLAAGTDRRNAIVDRSSGASQQVGDPIATPTSEAMIQEMLTHD